MGTTFTGADDMMKRLRKLREQLPDHFGRALRQEAELEATEAKKRCPVDTGALRASIHAEGPKREGRKITCEIVAGGAAEPYALQVHEDLDAQHDNGEAKFIESTLNESAPHMGDRIAQTLRDEGRM